MIKDTTDNLPNVSIYKINTDSTQGDTIVQYYNQWQERSKITDDTKLAEFDKLYPNAYLGNITKRQYELLLDYADADNQEQFLIDNPELNISPREEYLTNNYKDNALLAVWGKSNIYSLEAYKEAQSLIKELDIPDNAIEFELPNEDAFTKWFDYIEGYGWFWQKCHLFLIICRLVRLQKIT